MNVVCRIRNRGGIDGLKALQNLRIACHHAAEIIVIQNENLTFLAAGGDHIRARQEHRTS